MDLPNLLNKFKNSPVDTKKFLAIEIGFDTVKTAIWQSNGTHSEVVSIGSVQTWSKEQEADLLSAIDASLADAQVGVEVEPDQVIFGLPEAWVVGEAIADTKKGMLRGICQKLGLRPLGFVVTSEAMCHHLRNIEGGPPSAIIVRFSATELSCSLIHHGSVVATQVVERSAAVAADVEEGIARIPHIGNLPSRIILLSDMEETESIRQEMLSYDWQKRLEFLHIPQIEVLPKDWSIKAVAIAGGGEVIEALGIENVGNKPVAAPAKTAATTPPTNLGFTTVVIDESESVPETVEKPEAAESLASSNQDNFLESDTETIEPIRDEPVEESLLLEPETPIAKKKFHFPRIPFPSGNMLVPVILAIVLVAVVGGGFAAYRILPEATITVAVGLNPFEQQLTFNVDPAVTSASLESLTIPGTKASVDTTGSKTITTTGTRTVGERAKGKVVIYNRTTSPKTLPAGTTLKSGNLKFSLDTTVTVASASTKENADFSITTEPSKVEAQATAADIGDQYNIGKDQQLSVSNFSSESFIASVISGFSGGTSRKVQAVSKEDATQVKEALIAELQAQMTAESAAGGSDGRRRLPVGDPTVTTENYSAKVGEEASELTLEISMSQAIYEYDINEVTLLAQHAAEQALPTSAQMKPDSTNVSIQESSIGDNDVATIKANVVIQYIPRIDTNEYVPGLVNAQVAGLDSSLQAIPNYVSHTLDSKWLLFGRLPLNANEIQLRINPVARN